MNTPIEIDDDNTVWTIHRSGVAPQVVGVSYNGVDHDISNNDIYFRTKSGISIKAIASVSHPGCVEIPFSFADIDAIPLRGSMFHVIDETEQRIYAEGEVFAKGFRT
jgi:hypothetical protein